MMRKWLKTAIIWNINFLNNSMNEIKLFALKFNEVHSCYIYFTDIS